MEYVQESGRDIPKFGMVCRKQWLFTSIFGAGELYICLSQWDNTRTLLMTIVFHVDMVWQCVSNVLSYFKEFLLGYLVGELT